MCWWFGCGARPERRASAAGAAAAGESAAGTAAAAAAGGMAMGAAVRVIFSAQTVPNPI